MGPIWVLLAPCWPHEPCYQGCIMPHHHATFIKQKFCRHLTKTVALKIACLPTQQLKKIQIQCRHHSDWILVLNSHTQYIVLCIISLLGNLKALVLTKINKTNTDFRTLITNYIYRRTSNISRTLVGDKLVDQSCVYVVGALAIGAAPTTSSVST